MKKPAERGLLTHSAGFAIRSPRGIGEPHGIAPRGSKHLSPFQYAARQAARKATFAGPTWAKRRRMHLSANQALAAGLLAPAEDLQRHDEAHQPPRRHDAERSPELAQPAAVDHHGAEGVVQRRERE